MSNSASGKVCVYRPAHAIEGHLVKGLLEGHGIEVHLTGESLTGGYSGVPAASEVRVLVAAKFEDRARKRLAEYERASASQWYCGQCGEQNDAAFEVCWNCGANAPDRNDKT